MALRTLCLLLLLGLSLAQTIPSARPPPAKRKFNSTAIESVITSISSRMKDKDLATLFTNCFPNTLDTTVSYFNASGPDSYVITGDIDAQWLRDSTNQVLPYIQFAPQDPNLKLLICGLIKRHSRDVLHDPYANSFNFDDSGAGHQDDQRKPPMTKHVFEGKYELDSLAAAMKLSYAYFNFTRDTSCFDETWQQAMQLIVSTIADQQQGTLEEGDNYQYSFMRLTTVATDTQMMNGRGPAAMRCGMSKCAFRPSDDAVTLPFLVPANAMAVVELYHLAEIFSTLGNSSFAAQIKTLAGDLDSGIQSFGIGTRVTQHLSDPKQLNPAMMAAPSSGSRNGIRCISTQEGSTCFHASLVGSPTTVYAYEADGYGSQTFMDDANIPSLLSLPYLGYVTKDDPVYQSTRQYVLSPSNPYFFSGTAGKGVGGPHEGMNYIWPMSIIMQALTSDSDEEISWCLDTLKASSAGTGFLHESFWKDDVTKFTRPWFAWCNSLFGELIVTLARERPHLIFDSARMTAP